MNNVDNLIDITFIDDATWRATIQDVLVNGVPVGASNWTLTAGNLQLNPANITALQSNGNKTIAVKATGYNDTQVNQQILVGAVNAAKSTVSVAPPLNENTTSTFTMTAKDKYENVVSGHQFKYDVEIVNNDPATTEIYTINGSSHTTSLFNQGQTTNINGQTTFTIGLPAHIDTGDGITITPKLDSSPSIGTPFTFTK